MKCLVILIFCTWTSAKSDLELWKEFKSKHAKLYSTHQEDDSRYLIFQSNLEKIKNHNQKFQTGKTSYQLGVTEFSDLTNEEFRNKFLNLKATTKIDEGTSRTIFIGTDEEVPKAIDWRDVGAVTSVKRQGECGACWAFATVAAVEGHNYIANKKLFSLSEQQVIDCAHEPQLSGCEGGQLDPAYQYMEKNGLQTEESYLFEEKTATCRYNVSQTVVNVTGWVDVKANNEKALEEAVGLKGPVAVAINSNDLQLYTSGIYDDEDCPQGILNHAVTVVGYGTQNGTDYWILKNSFGVNFGENGFVRFKKWVNQCGMADKPSYPVVAHV